MSLLPIAASALVLVGALTLVMVIRRAGRRHEHTARRRELELVRRRQAHLGSGLAVRRRSSRSTLPAGVATDALTEIERLRSEGLRQAA